MNECFICVVKPQIFSVPAGDGTEASLRCWCFSPPDTGKLIKIEGKMIGVEWRKILEGNWEFEEDSPFNTTVNQNISPKPHRSGLKSQTKLSSIYSSSASELFTFNYFCVFFFIITPFLYHSRLRFFILMRVKLASKGHHTFFCNTIKGHLKGFMCTAWLTGFCWWCLGDWYCWCGSHTQKI